MQHSLVLEPTRLGLVASHIHANVFLTIGIGMLIAALLALVVGFLSIKAYGFYFLMLTLACSQIVYSIIYQWTPVTGGSNGLSGIPVPVLFGDFELSNQVFIYYFILVVFGDSIIRYQSIFTFSIRLCVYRNKRK